MPHSLHIQEKKKKTVKTRGDTSLSKHLTHFHPVCSSPQDVLKVRGFHVGDPEGGHVVGAWAGRGLLNQAIQRLARRGQEEPVGLREGEEAEGKRYG